MNALALSARTTAPAAPRIAVRPSPAAVPVRASVLKRGGMPAQLPLFPPRPLR